MKAKEILFRPSEIYQIMPNARTKTTNADKYNALEKKIEKLNKELAKAETQEDINAIVYNIEILNRELKALEPFKNLPNLSKTTESYLKQKYIEIMYGRRKEIDNKYMRKGRECEEAGITLYSLIKNRLFENNKLRVNNKYFTGEIDIAIKDKQGNVIEIADIKNSYDAHTFIDNLDNIKDANMYQGMAYMDLHASCQRFRIANVLVDNSPEAILQALYYESFKWPENDTPAWREIELVKSHIYTKKAFDEFLAMRGIMPSDDQAQAVYDSFVEIPQEARLIEHVIDRDEVCINDIKIRIDECREWMRIMFNM